MAVKREQENHKAIPSLTLFLTFFDFFSGLEKLAYFSAVFAEIYKCLWFWCLDFAEISGLGSDGASEGSLPKGAESYLREGLLRLGFSGCFDLKYL